MKTLRQYISEAPVRKTHKEIVSLINGYKKAGEILNPEYQELVFQAKKSFEEDGKLGKNLILNYVRNNQTDDAAGDVYYDWPSDSFVSIKKFKRELDVLSKMKYDDKQTQFSIDAIVKIGNKLYDDWAPVADDLKELKTKVVKVTQKRAEKKEADRKALNQKKADMSPMVNALQKPKKEYLEKVRAGANEFVKNTLAELRKVKMDLNAIAPREDRSKSQKRQILAMVTDPVDTGYKKRGAPDIRKRSKKGIDLFIKQNMEQAEANYDAFINKMVAKVNKSVKTAKLTGSIWTNATLTVTTTDGETEKWVTKVIINFSKYGKMFNQFPTRKMK